MAGQLGLSVTAYGNLERGESQVTVERLEEIATILQVTTYDILSLSDQPIFRDFTQSGGVVANYGHVVSAEVEGYKALVEEQKAQIAHYKRRWIS